MYISFSRKHVK